MLRQLHLYIPRRQQTHQTLDDSNPNENQIQQQLEHNRYLVFSQCDLDQALKKMNSHFIIAKKINCNNVHCK